ncbi:hypothetical protein MPNT_40021 [Candidatus Methylacidithermus pantelleriae]|uniref:Uncharacterized protein n=1 Tax=Candidatus Methylacidithermus pantelleriae TaxID=2744239 RepID=A0A8J2FWQ9_9BACT|nr:hypothetical protein MPNT_40021 [Candidatus Methylacidithermus pantelleriae]
MIAIDPSSDPICPSKRRRHFRVDWNIDFERAQALPRRSANRLSGKDA